MSRIASHHPPLLAALQKLGIDTENTTRIVIDINPRDGVRIFTEQIAGEALADVALSLEGIEITTMPGPAGAEEGGQ